MYNLALCMVPVSSTPLQHIDTVQTYLQPDDNGDKHPATSIMLVSIPFPASRSRIQCFVTSEVVLLIAYWSRGFKRAKPGSVELRKKPLSHADRDLLHAAIAPST